MRSIDKAGGCGSWRREAMTATKIAAARTDTPIARTANRLVRLPELRSRLSSAANSPRISANDSCRSSGLFSRHRCTTRSTNMGTSVRQSRKRCGVLFRMADKIARSLSPLNGRSPVSISYNRTPNENTPFRPMVDALSLSLFRRHVADGAHERTNTGKRFAESPRGRSSRTKVAAHVPSTTQSPAL